jgi:hypothetical protein
LNEEANIGGLPDFRPRARFESSIALKRSSNNSARPITAKEKSAALSRRA